MTLRIHAFDLASVVIFTARDFGLSLGIKNSACMGANISADDGRVVAAVLMVEVMFE